ncbi:RTA1 like protein-domain-containing protein [Mycena galopus ATCC 62051]|nr:RTA1 like protein-domain-containing protein [Mycena galopus ATCC 62051]
MALIADGVPRVRPTHTQHCSSMAPIAAMYPSDWLISIAKRSAAGGFKPNKTLAILAAFLWALSPHFHLFHWWRSGRPRFMISLIMGMYVSCLGYTLRSIYIRFPHSEGLFIAMNEVTLLAPCLFYIVTYILFARLLSTFKPEVVERCLPVRASRMTSFFVSTTLLLTAMQAAGDGIAAVHGSTAHNVGNKLTLLAVGFEFFFVELFILVLFIFRRRMLRSLPETWHHNDAPRFTLWGRTPIAWQALFYILAGTSTLLLLRSVYRIVEFSLGQSGYLAQHEVFLYCFDALPLWLAMSVYCVVWPTRALQFRSMPTLAPASQIPLVHV